MITIYHYNGQTGEYLSTGQVHEDPLVPGTHPLPANATAVAPPAVAEGYARVWSGAAWEQVEDHRGAEGWVNGIAYTVADLGPLPDGWSTETPAPTVEDKILAIEAKYEEKFAALRVRITNVLLADGLAEDPKRTALAVEWQAEQDARDLEILELLGGV